MATFVVKFEKLSNEYKFMGFIESDEKKFSDIAEALTYRNERLESKDFGEMKPEVRRIKGHVCLLTNLDAEMFGYPLLPHSDTKITG